MQGQREQHTILAGDELHFGSRIELRDNIAVTQRHAFGRAGCSRCVKQHCFIVAADRRELRLIALKESLPTLFVVLVGIEQDELWFFFEIEFLDPFHPLFRRDNRARITVSQRMNQSFVAKLDIQRHSHHTRANDSQRGRNPLRAVFRKERNGIAAFEIILGEPVPERSRAIREFFKRPTMSIFLAEED